ncbi:MAG: flagellar hook-associated protein FlgK [Gemmatimonadaceae bacterium]|nr:flagellar hook-associated protein FlgK [Gemmatimonadaceae bacterium]
MSTFGSILSIARGAIASHQAAIQTTSHNLANAETEGFSRQRVELVPSTPQRFPFYSIGTGVSISDIVRYRDQLLDNTYRREVGNSEAFSLRRDLMSEIESVLGEPSDTGLAATLDEFWNAWADLSNNPGNGAAQGVVRQRGAQAAYMLNTFATQLADLGNRTRSRMSDTVDQINGLAQQVATLNRQITAAEVGGQQAPDLRDQRDRLADQLAKLTGARTEPQANGTVGVHLGTMMLVDAANARTLEARGGTQVSLGMKGDPDPLVGVTGPLAAMVDFINTDLPSVTGRLDQLARALVNGVNEYHMSGWTAAGDALGNSNWVPANGPTGSRVAFFDPAFVSAGTIRLSSAVVANAAVIASGDVQNAPGNNTIALAVAALRNDTGVDALRTRMGAAFATQVGLATDTSYLDHYTQVVTDVGVSVDESGNQFAIYDTLARQADTRRASVSGVSIDEELTLLMRHQQAYAAAAKLVKAADEMAQVILGMV